MKKELEFKLTDKKVLTVADFDWYINNIDTIYVRHTEIGRKSEYAIFIQQGSEIVELYYRTQDELAIAREYKKLCNAIKEANPMFDNSVQPFVLINYANLKGVEGSKNKRFLEYELKLKFKNSYLNMFGNKNEHNQILEKLNEIKENNATI